MRLLICLFALLIASACGGGSDADSAKSRPSICVHEGGRYSPGAMVRTAEGIKRCTAEGKWVLADTPAK